MVMNNEIMTFLSNYITVYERYKDSIGKKGIVKKLTRVYNELLDAAEKYPDDFPNFEIECRSKKILVKFDKIVKKCQKEFQKH
jgi:hypothetical protein